ncbi:MAG: cell envelope integrity protein TolA [Gammaproteobacteria bacterium]|nr:cell envelope integrity protein TolA [Gammaproteobacteria bacterium]
MRLGWFDTLRSFIYSIGVHVILAVILIVSFQFMPQPVFPPPAQVDIVQAVAVDESKVEAEITRLKEEEQRKRDAEGAHQRELQRQAEAAKQKREAEEKRTAELQKQQAEEKQKKEEETKDLEKLKQEKEALEIQRKAEEERLKEAERKRAEEEKRKEQEKRKQEEEQRRIEEEKQKQLAERKRIDEEKRRKEEEQARLAELKTEEEALERERLRQEQSVIDRYITQIRAKVSQVFIYPEKGLSCELFVRMIPGGDVVEAKVIKSSGNAIFDRQAEIAVMKASPLPVPEDPRVFERMRDIRFEFEPI